MAKSKFIRTEVLKILIGTLCFFLSVSPLSSFGQEPRISVRPSAIEDEVSLDYFGSQVIELPVKIQGALDVNTQLQVQLVQRSAALEAPIIPSIPVSYHNISDIPGEATALIKFMMPDVRRETEFALRIFESTESQPDVLIAEWILHGYPRDHQKIFQQWSEQIQLRVSDEKGELSAFLGEQAMSFQDYRAPARESRPVVTLAVHTGERSFRRERFIKPGQTTIIFHEDTDPLAHILVNKDAESRTIDVHMKLFDTLPNNPRTQQMLLEIFQMTKD